MVPAKLGRDIGDHRPDPGHESFKWAKLRAGAAVGSELLPVKAIDANPENAVIAQRQMFGNGNIRMEHVAALVVGCVVVRVEIKTLPVQPSSG